MIFVLKQRAIAKRTARCLNKDHARKWDGGLVLIRNGLPFCGEKPGGRNDFLLNRQPQTDVALAPKELGWHCDTTKSGSGFGPSVWGLG